MGNCITGAPNVALIKSGCQGTSIGVGRTVFHWWICEQCEPLSLEMMTIGIESHEAETAKGVRVSVKSVAQVKVNAFKGKEDNSGTMERGAVNTAAIWLAAQHFLGDTEEKIRDALRRTLEGHQRQILGTLTVEELYKDRQAFSETVRRHVVDDLTEMGFALVSYVVQKIDDENGYMESLGVTQTAIVKREAAEGSAKNDAEARKKVAVYKAEAEIAEAKENQTAHVSVNEQKQSEAESDRDLNLKKAAFDREVNQARAEAASAGPIEEARQKQAIVREQTKQLQVEEQIKLDIAEQTVARMKREREGEAEANFLAQNNEAKAITVIANAEAEKVIAMGQAQAKVIELQGAAEAKVLEDKAQAFQQYGEAAVVQMIVEKLPELAEKISAPLAKTDKMVFVSSDGSGGSQLIGDSVKILGQLPEAVQGLTGFDMKEAMKSLAGQKGGKEREL